MNSDHAQVIENALAVKLKARQERMITELTTQSTVRKAAENAGVPEQTARRWLRCDAIFLNRYREARREIVDGAVKFCGVASSSCAQILWKIAQNEENSPAARVAACKAMIDISLRGLESVELAQRVEALERGDIQIKKALPAIEGHPQ